MEKRAHADRCQSLPVDLPDDMGKYYSINLSPRSYYIFLHSFTDLMIEVIKLTNIYAVQSAKESLGKRQRAGRTSSVSNL